MLYHLNNKMFCACCSTVAVLFLSVRPLFWRPVLIVSGMILAAVSAVTQIWDSLRWRDDSAASVAMTISKKRLLVDWLCDQSIEKILIEFTQFKWFSSGLNTLWLFFRLGSLWFPNWKGPLYLSQSLLIFLLIIDSFGNLAGDLIWLRLSFFEELIMLRVVVGPVDARPFEPLLLTKRKMGGLLGNRYLWLVPELAPVASGEELLCGVRLVLWHG